MRVKRNALMALLALFASTAFAGYTQPQVVEIDPAGFAHGDQWTARVSDNDLEHIGCGIRKIDDGVGGVISFGFCQARDAAGVEAFCFTENAALLEAMESTSAFAYVTFNWNVDGQCTRIGNSTQSFYLPELKAK